MLLHLMLNPAFALTFLDASWVDYGTVVTTTEVPFAPNGIGAPAVEWDATRSRFVMAFEFRSNVVHASCPVGVWGIGTAESTDGFVWTNFQQIYLPDPGGVDAGTSYQCVVAHPDLIWPENNNDAAGILFKAENGSFQGINALAIAYDVAGNASLSAPPNGVNLIDIPSQFGYHSFGKLTAPNYWGVIVQIGPDIYVATTNGGSPLRRLSWLLGSGLDLVLEPDPLGPAWQQDELFDPQPYCDDSGNVSALLGGRNYGPGGSVAMGGTAWATETAGVWTMDAANPVATWDNDREMRHWSLLLANTDDLVLWYSRKNATDPSKTEIGVMATAAAPWANPRGRSCP